MGTLGIAPPIPASEPFTPGSVTARAQSIRFGGFTGGTEFALTMGIALSRAQGSQGNSQAQAIDLGIFGLLLSAESECTGDPVLLSPDQVPRPLRTNSVNGPSSGQADLADGQVARGARESVYADPEPRASATTQIAQFDLGPLLSIAGLRSDAEANIDAANETRRGSSAASVGALEIAEGLVRLEGLRWDLTTTSGTGENESGTFTVGRILLGGVPLGVSTPDDLAQALNTVNAALAPLGLSLGIPVIEHRGDTVEVTPLLIRVGGLDSAPLLGPVMAALQPFRDIAYEVIIEQLACPVNPGTVNGALTVADIVLAALAGAGGLTFEIGGTRTAHDTAFYASPLGAALPSLGAETPGRTPTVLEEPGVAARSADPAVPATQAAAGPISTRCETTHPSGSPGCWQGSAALAGGLSLLAALGLLGTDAYRSRRREASP